MKEFLTFILDLVEKRQNTAGIDYKINISSQWGGTIGLRLNGVIFDGIATYIGAILNYLDDHKLVHKLAYCSISKSFEMSKTTSKKQQIPWKRTIFVTIYLPKELHKDLRARFPNAIENYRPLRTLVKNL